MPEHEHQQESDRDPEPREATIEDLDVADADAADVKGGVADEPLEWRKSVMDGKVEH